MSSRYTAYTRLKIDHPADRTLRLTFDRPETYNSVDAQTHIAREQCSHTGEPREGSVSCLVGGYPHSSRSHCNLAKSPAARLPPRNFRNVAERLSVMSRRL
jgi:hypothetical protein